MMNVKKISLDSIYKPKSEEDIERERKAREARSAAIQHMGIASKSSGKVRDYLVRQAFDPGIVECVLTDLIDDGTIDDRKMANRILRERQAGKGESKAAMRARMIRQGVAGHIVDELDSELISDDASAATLVRTRFAKELQAFKLADRDAKRRLLGKMNRFLQSRGYSSSCARKAICDALTVSGDACLTSDDEDID